MNLQLFAREEVGVYGKGWGGEHLPWPVDSIKATLAQYEFEGWRLSKWNKTGRKHTVMMREYRARRPFYRMRLYRPATREYLSLTFKFRELEPGDVGKAIDAAPLRANASEPRYHVEARGSLFAIRDTIEGIIEHWFDDDLLAASRCSELNDWWRRQQKPMQLHEVPDEGLPDAVEAFVAQGMADFFSSR
jgi:hypothetical protein